jgi:hypothetical protein
VVRVLRRRVEHREGERAGDGHDDSHEDTDCDRKAFDEHGPIIGTGPAELDGLGPETNDVPNKEFVKSR